MRHCFLIFQSNYLFIKFNHFLFYLLLLPLFISEIAVSLLFELLDSFNFTRFDADCIYDSCSISLLFRFLLALLFVFVSFVTKSTHLTCFVVLFWVDHTPTFDLSRSFLVFNSFNIENQFMV
eukprot:108329_1